MKLQEDYCSYELSKLLKEKGLKGITRRYFYNGGLFCDNNVNESDWNSKGDKWVSQPTYQMAMKWLREEKGIYVYVEPYLLGGTYIDELEVHYCGRILDTNRRRLYSIENMTSYTEAIEERIEYALKNLI